MGRRRQRKKNNIVSHHPTMGPARYRETSSGLALRVVSFYVLMLIGPDLEGRSVKISSPVGNRWISDTTRGHALNFINWQPVVDLRHIQTEQPE